MEDLVRTAQTNDLAKLHRCLDLERAENTNIGENGTPKSTMAMQATCHTAARYNHPAALDLLLDSSYWIDRGEHIKADCISVKALTDF